MDDPDVPQSVKNSIEFVVDISGDNNHILTYELKKNETRAVEAKKIREKVLETDKKNKNKERIDKDVLIIYMDNISRVHFHRKMKKLNRWLDQYSDNYEISQVASDSLQDFSEDRIDPFNFENNSVSYKAYEFFRYHSHMRATSLNVNSLYYGSSTNLKTESEYVFHHFKNNGYIIGSFANECELDAADYEENTTFSLPFVRFDNYGGSIACDMNYDSTLQMDIVLDKGRNSQYRRCLYGKEMHKIQLDYITQFWDSYPENRKAFRSKFNENHEATGELIKYNDEDTVEFLKNFDKKGHLNKTIVYFISDHGQHFIVGHIPLFPDNSRFEENVLPLLIVLAPTDIPEQNMKFLKENQQHFTNGLDIYSSLKSIAVGIKSQSNIYNSYSFLHENLPLNRDCHINTEGVDYSDCYCSIDKLYIEKKSRERSIFYIQL